MGKSRGFYGRLGLGVLLVFGVASLAGAANPIPAGFTLEDITNSLEAPVAFGFTDGGRLYVAEKRGTVQVFDSVDDPTPTQVINVSNNVHDYWDRGLLGLAVDPQFGSGSDYVYLLYTYDPGNSWGDDCAAGGTTIGCLVNGRLSRFPINGSGSAGAEQVLLTGGWCAQFPSHTIGDLAFAGDGSLLVSAGDGASFNLRRSWRHATEPGGQRLQRPAGCAGGGRQRRWGAAKPGPAD